MIDYFLNTTTFLTFDIFKLYRRYNFFWWEGEEKGVNYIVVIYFMTDK